MLFFCFRLLLSASVQMSCSDRLTLEKQKQSGNVQAVITTEGHRLLWTLNILYMLKSLIFWVLQSEMTEAPRISGMQVQ